MRILLYTGKGGVGKTSVAAASALRCARLGYRTIVLSTDAAHSLGDCFDIDLGPEPTPVTDNLWGQECDISHNLDKHWGTVQKWVESLLRWQGVESMVAEEIAVLPGMEELANLLWINQHHERSEYDVIIVDCAPSAETFRLLSFPGRRPLVDRQAPAPGAHRRQSRSPIRTRRHQHTHPRGPKFLPPSTISLTTWKNSRPCSQIAICRPCASSSTWKKWS